AEALIEAADGELLLVPRRRPGPSPDSSNAESGPRPSPGNTIEWRGTQVATLKPGPNLVRPRITLDRALDVLDPQARTAIQARLDTWFAAQVARHLPVLAKLD